MDTITAPPPPAAAPAAVTPPPASTLTNKPISEAAHNLFKMLEESSKPAVDEDDNKPEPDKPVAPVVASAEPAKPAAEEKPVKVSKKAPKRPDLPIAKTEPVIPHIQTATPAAPTTDANWEESLIEDEKAALEDARFAEQVNPKYKGLTDKMGRFFREQKKFLDAHPDAQDDDPEYQKVLAMMPMLSPVDKREIAEARIEEKVAQKHEGKFADLQHELYVRDEEPKIENEAAQIRKYMAFNSLPADMLKTFRERGVSALQKEYADELEVAGGLINTLTEDAKELLRITRISPKTGRPIEKAADNENHPKWAQHKRIADMVDQACLDFQKNAPQVEQVRNGKWFVTRDEWAKLDPSARHQFWTFTNSTDDVREMINRAIGWMPEAIDRTIKSRQEALKVRGYIRQRPETPAVLVAEPPKPVSSPSTPRPSPAPSPASTPSGQLTPGQMVARRINGG